jgi:PLP dependent protein
LQRSKKPQETSLDRLASVRARIALAARDAGRLAQSITLVCVTKTFAAEEIKPVIEAGVRVFGENRVQEALAKWPKLREAYPDIELHLIGPLQSNKAREAIAFFGAIETVDREKIAKALAGEIQKTSRHPKLFVQVNTGAEPQKAGILPQEADAFIASCRKDYGLEISGLMCIPPVDDQAAQIDSAILAVTFSSDGKFALSEDAYGLAGC